MNELKTFDLEFKLRHDKITTLMDCPSNLLAIVLQTRMSSDRTSKNA